MNIIKSKNEIIILFDEQKQKGDSLVWHENFAYFVGCTGNTKRRIKIGGNKMEESTATKTTETKTTKVAKKIAKKPATTKVENAVSPPVSEKKATKKEALAKILLTLPKAGKTVDQLVTQSTINSLDAKYLSDFAVFLGIITSKNDKYYPI